jgi:hypothetical protein
MCLVLALWNSAMGTSQGLDSPGQGFRISNLVVGGLLWNLSVFYGLNARGQTYSFI